MSTLKPWLRWLADVGPTRAGWRIGHEFITRSGVVERLAPVDELPELSSSGLTLRQWLHGLPSDHWFRITRDRITSDEARAALESLLSPREQDALIERARRASRGVILAHGGLELDFLEPRQWRLAPLDPEQRCWPLVHGQRIWSYSKTLGDIKDVWAVGRALYVFDWVRARGLQGTAGKRGHDSEQPSSWARLLARDFRSFEAQNPWRAGPHWASGQECAIRALVWCFGVAALGEDDGFEQEDFARFLGLIELHARFLDQNLDFARFAVPNNHLIIESIALAAIGVLFPWFRDAERYRRRGASVLNDEALSQFLPDGSYVQASHNYHRLATEYLLWAARLLPAELLSPHRLRGIFVRTQRFLEHQMCSPSRGHLPNWGANDGARMHRLSETEHRDYRPLLVSLALETGIAPSFDKGAWDEEAYWLAGRLPRPTSPTKSEQSEAGSRGLVTLGAPITAPITTLERGDWRAMFRTQPPLGLASQCDLFHVDIWRGEQNLALDAGSHRYHDDDWHEWFSGAASHNVLCLLSPQGEVLGPLERPARFAYHANEDMARVVRLERASALATHSGWRAAGVLYYEREVRVARDGCEVIDRIDTREPIKIRVHWLLEDLGWSVSQSGFSNGSEPVNITAEGEPVLVSLNASEERGGILRREVCLSRGASPQDPPPLFAGSRIAGWFSPSYGVRRCAVSVLLVCDLSPGSYEITTEFIACASR